MKKREGDKESMWQKPFFFIMKQTKNTHSHISPVILPHITNTNAHIFESPVAQRRGFKPLSINTTAPLQKSSVFIFVRINSYCWDYCSFSRYSIIVWIEIWTECNLMSTLFLQQVRVYFKWGFSGHFLKLHLTASIKDLEAYIKHAPMSSYMWPCHAVYSVISAYLLCQLLPTGFGIHPHVYAMVIHVWACGLSPTELTKGHILAHTATVQPHKHAADCGGRGGKERKGEREQKAPATWFSQHTHARMQYSVNRMKESEQQIKPLHQC